jgi:hypothetical protein
MVGISVENAPDMRGEHRHRGLLLDGHLDGRVCNTLNV